MTGNIRFSAAQRWMIFIFASLFFHGANVSAAEKMKSDDLRVIEYPSLTARCRPGVGQLLIFIPGLGGGESAWDEVTSRLHEERFCTLVLAGFGGKPAISEPYFPKIESDLIDLISSLGDKRAVLIGHSLGAYLAYRTTLHHPEKVAAVISVDGYPVFVPFADLTPEQRVAAADKFAVQLVRGKSPEQFQSSMKKFIAAKVSSADNADRLAREAVKSDPLAMDEFLVEMLSDDLRPQLAAMTQPALALIASESYKKGMDDDQMRGFYQSRIFGNAQHVTLSIVHNSRHFMGDDQPQIVADSIEKFIGK